MRRNPPSETLPTEPAERLETDANLRLETEMSVSQSAGTERENVLLTRREIVYKKVKNGTKKFYKKMIFNFSMIIYLKLISFLMLLQPFNINYAVLGLIFIELISIIFSYNGVKKSKEITNKKTLMRCLVKDVAFMDIFSRLFCYVLYFVYGKLVKFNFTFSCIPFYINTIYQIIKIFMKKNKVNIFKILIF